MTRNGTRRIFWWALVVVIVVGFGIALVSSREFEPNDLVIIPFYGYAAVGALIAWRRPENPIGWVFLLIGDLTSLAGVAGAGTRVAMHHGFPVPWWGELAAWYNAWFWTPLFVLATTFTFLLFPTGLPSRRWRPVFWLAVVSTLLASGFSALSAQIELGTDPVTGKTILIDNPLSPALLDGVAGGESDWVVIVPLLVGLLCGLAAVYSVVARTWRSRGVERLQMRLFAFAILLVVLSVALSAVLPTFGDSWAGGVLFAAALGGIPIACGTAILRYHLYDIDRVIGRTTSYALLTAVLLIVYAGVVTSVGRLLPNSSDSLAVAAATLAAAAVFRPVLGWARRIVSRRFNREQYDAELVVERFAVRLRTEVESTEIRDDLLDVLNRTMQPAASGLWLADREVR